jgi:hypothetical protein
LLLRKLELVHLYEIRPRNRGVDLISNALPFGRLWYLEVSDAIDYAKHVSRSHHAVIRVYDAAGNVIETHEHKGNRALPGSVTDCLGPFALRVCSIQAVRSLTDLTAPNVLRSNRVQPPSTSAMIGEAYQFLQPDQILRHRPFPATVPPNNACSMFAICLLTSAFASLCASVVLPSTISAR